MVWLVFFRGCFHLDQLTDLTSALHVMTGADGKGVQWCTARLKVEYKASHYDLLKLTVKADL